MKITVNDYNGVHSIQLPLENIPYLGVYDSAGKEIMKYYDQTGKKEWLVDPVKIINELHKTIEE